MRPLASLGVIAACARIYRLQRRVGCLGGRQHCATATAYVSASACLERSQRVRIEFSSIRLEIDASIPFEAEPVERREELIRETRDAALAVEIVDPDQPAAGGVTCAQVAAGGSQQRAEVQRSGWSRGEAAAGCRGVSGTSRRGRRTASRGARAAPGPPGRGSRPAAPPGA